MRNLKYLTVISFVLAISLSSCSKDDKDDDVFRSVYVNVLEADLPDEFDYGNIYNIDVTIELPNSCYIYYDEFNYVYKGDERLIFPIAYIEEGDNCTQSTEETTFSIRFQALQTKPYVFKFYQGKDTNGENMYLTYTVPVNIGDQNSIGNLDSRTEEGVHH
ncbi:hypothetical protein [Flagellimonas eckloniae]|uniref:Lipoprotein n=1 Tax=Flagellimonas eckloniae TaxID=346185 RepID=A0A0Q1H534_9FLAO|nr:hypothetical protein [Allomuricauda eckloniae]KQC28620.1 hypothetical protein AAY42_00900 [Allomuricauda eckloniae]